MLRIKHLEPLEDRNFFENLGFVIKSKIYYTGAALRITIEAFRWFTAVFQRRSEVTRQMFRVGVTSLAVTQIVALFTGMILSLQAGLELKEFNQEVNVGIIVSQTMCREMGPFMTALILAASVGSAMAAELGTMKVSEEIDALEVMNINPVRYLVMPRLVALLIMTPVLTVFTDIVGIIGGGVVAKTQLDVSWEAYNQNVMDFLKLKSIYVGLFKAAVFGIILATISSFQGLTTRNVFYMC